MDTTIQVRDTSLKTSSKNEMASSTSQYKKKVTSLRRMVRGARKSMERRGDRLNKNNKPSKRKDDPSESETHESTLSESVREVGLTGGKPLRPNGSLGSDTPFLPRGDSGVSLCSEASLGSARGVIKRVGSKRAMFSDCSSWGRIQTSVRTIVPDSSPSSLHTSDRSLDPKFGFSDQSQSHSSLIYFGEEWDGIDEPFRYGHDSGRSLGSWGDLCVDNKETVHRLHQSFSAFLRS